MTTREELRAEADAVTPDLIRAREVAMKAESENRPMTGAEKAVYDSAMAKARPLLDRLDAARKGREAGKAWASVDELRALHSPAGPGVKDTSRRLSYKGMAAGVAANMMGGDGIGAKVLAPSGATVIPQSFTPDPVPLGRPAQSLLDLVPVRTQATAEYAFIRQGTRTNNAAVVDEGNVKPTTVLGLTRVEQSLEVVAHLSEGIPRYWLADNEAVEVFVNNELEYGLRAAIEAKLLGDVDGTSGIQEQDYSTSIVETIRKGLTKLEIAGHAPAAIALHPADFEAVELAIASTDAISHQGLPYDPAARRLFGVPIATTVSQVEGTGHVLGAGSVMLDVDNVGVSIVWSETSNDEDFSRNLIRARCEQRVGTSVMAPLGVVVLDLAAGS
jgi:HK97 family phage major capsid protein